MNFAWKEAGEIVLRISFFSYLFFLLPQIIHNLHGKSIEGLSLKMHGILFLGYIFDFAYGNGRDMEIEYRLVTISGLIFLCLQHYQFWRYSQNITKELCRLVAVFILCFMGVSYFLWVGNERVFVLSGWLAHVCFLTYLLPQMLKNYQNKSTKDLSFGFVCLGIVSVSCDLFCAWALEWDIPSKVGSGFALLIKIILLRQFYLYNSACKS